MSEPDLEALRYALAVARNRGFAEVEIRSGASMFEARLDLSTRPANAPHQAAIGASEPAAPKGLEITATLVGYYEEAKPALQIGKRVERGERVATITALGLANDVEASVTGEVVEVLVKHG